MQLLLLPTWLMFMLSNIGSNVIDTHSSYGKLETNWILGQGRYKTRQLAIQYTIVTGTSLFTIFTRKNPKVRKTMILVNGITTSVHIGVAIRNYRINHITTPECKLELYPIDSKPVTYREFDRSINRN